MKELLKKFKTDEATLEDVLQAIDEADKDKVPRSRLNDKIDDIKELQGQLKDRDKQLEELGNKAKDSDTLTAEIERLKTENEQKDADYQEKLQKQALETALTDALRVAKVRNPKIAKSALNLDDIKLDGDKLLGLDAQLSALKESDDYLFVQEEEPKLGGRNPNPTKNPPTTELTKDKLKTLSYKELVQYKQDNPEQYAALTKTE